MYQYINVPLNQNQFDSLVSFHFNLGPAILHNSLLLKYLNARQWQQAAAEMQRYKFAGGVVLQGLANRRRAETALFLKPVGNPATSNPQQPAKPNVPHKTYKVKPGDTLSQIAVKHGTTVARLVRLNGIKNPNLIRVGQVIVVS
ncbi:glycoside hydrolase family protein [Periweissella cryptocerci]|uniref:glycoside hydrolase family protein n=1 Tax=Periweissella cryptocerci TaxID=2506420 RepID=UPI002430558C|nr:LysM peptidoglycan-binding domain-containing protein [Periweissella cryptocerci]